jgi:hypothetical protein
VQLDLVVVSGRQPRQSEAIAAPRFSLSFKRQRALALEPAPVEHGRCSTALSGPSRGSPERFAD